LRKPNLIVSFTGKTKTILAVVSVFLAGALNPKKNGSTKIVAGTSFQAHANPRGKISESGKYMYQHSMASNAGYGLPPLHINTAAGSSTSSVYKPRVLLCAPSNTAVDELVFRLMTQVLILHLFLSVFFLI
jgi:superfamily I DNA and/or RNA helicase